jgi:hypothetical protein
MKRLKGEKGMTFKEAKRYANFLDGLLSKAYGYLYNKGFITTTTEEHLRSKADPDAQDETVTVQKPYDVDFMPNNVINFVVKVLNEKEALVDAIAKAKAQTEINIDNSISMNKKKQGFIDILESMANIKPSEKQKQGYGYKFNAQDGNQIKYFYDINEVTSIEFDRNDVKNLVKKYRKECDAVSSKLDAIDITMVVDHEPIFDISDKFEDLVLS